MGIKNIYSSTQDKNNYFILGTFINYNFLNGSFQITINMWGVLSFIILSTATAIIMWLYSNFILALFKLDIISFRLHLSPPDTLYFSFHLLSYTYEPNMKEAWGFYAIRLSCTFLTTLTFDINIWTAQSWQFPNLSTYKSFSDCAKW